MQISDHKSKHFLILLRHIDIYMHFMQVYAAIQL